MRDAKKRSYPSPASSIAIREVPYADQDVRLTGLLHWNDDSDDPAPGILLIHGGAGLDAHARQQAWRYAELSYTVLACDMFGEGTAGDREQMIACLTAMRDDPALLTRRCLVGLMALTRCPEVGETHAAVGFCFGGMAALTLARAGADLAAVVSIHGSLRTTKPAEPGSITAKILVCHGASDPHVPMDHVVVFTQEMQRADADWQLILYGHAQHGFTHQHAAPGLMTGVAYDPLADQRSFAATRSFLQTAKDRPA